MQCFPLPILPNGLDVTKQTICLLKIYVHNHAEHDNQYVVVYQTSCYRPVALNTDIFSLD